MKINLKICLLLVSATFNILMHAVIADFQKTESEDSTSLIRQACHLPVDTGICSECYQDTCYPRMLYNRVYYYDKYQDKCIQFYWGGCSGNFNNFKYKEDCEATCLGKKINVTAETQETVHKNFKSTPHVEEICNLIPDMGSCGHCARDGCHSNFLYSSTKYAYNVHEDKCVPFPYGGCGGNANKFDTIAKCEATCSLRVKYDLFLIQSHWGSPSSPPKHKSEICNLTPNYGHHCYRCDNIRCDFYTVNSTRFAFSPSEDRCIPFIWGGCGGNLNNFQYKTDCYAECPSLDPQNSISPAYDPEICNLDFDRGTCFPCLGPSCETKNLSLRFWYMNDIDACRIITYGGCGGNANNFKTEKECEATCVAL